ncbi:MAG: GTP-binding protein [Cellvibrionaceae bacterium]|jgi:GTP-binding protein
MNLQNPYAKAEFLHSAPDLAHCPKEGGFEVAFAGRSNAGKSSAINALTGNRKLARTSKTPGRTQLINYFQIDAQRALVDLPGYGYAKVPLKVKRQWNKNLSGYLMGRQSICGLVLLMDIRHPMQEFDLSLLSWAVAAAIPTHILLTKADKLRRGPTKNTLLAVEASIREAGIDGLVSAQTFSALKGQGIKTLIQTLNRWMAVGDDLHSVQLC